MRDDHYRHTGYPLLALDATCPECGHRSEGLHHVDAEARVLCVPCAARTGLLPKSACIWTPSGSCWDCGAPTPRSGHGWASLCVDCEPVVPWWKVAAYGAAVLLTFIAGVGIWVSLVRLGS